MGKLFPAARLISLLSQNMHLAVSDETPERGGVRPMALTLSEFQMDVLCDVAEFVRIQPALTVL